MKSCPNCRMEARIDAEWCWHCGYSYEEAEARARAARRVDDSGSEGMADVISAAGPGEPSCVTCADAA